MASRNDVTGDKIQTKGVLSKKGEENWDRIFKKEGITLTEEELANVEIIADIVQHHHDKKNGTRLSALPKAESAVCDETINAKRLTDAHNGL